MSIISRLFSGVRRLANRDQAERDLQDEVDQYLRESIAAKRRAGMSYEAAERAARVELGSASAATEPARSWGWDASLEAFLSDVRYAARTLGKAPGFTIGAALWKRRFAERPDIVGLDVRLNGQPFRVVGVAPPEFGGIQPGVVRDIYVPMMMQAWMRPPRAGYSGEMNPDLLTVRTNSWLFVVGRLNPGVTVEQATAQLDGVVRGMTDWTD